MVTSVSGTYQCAEIDRIARAGSVYADSPPRLCVGVARDGIQWIAVAEEDRRQQHSRRVRLYSR